MKTLEEIFESIQKERKLYCNVPDVYFVCHGEWSDPEVSYKNKLFNLPMDVETPLYDYYCEDCKEKGIKESEDGFEQYVENDPDELYEILENLIDACMYEEEELNISYDI